MLLVPVALRNTDFLGDDSAELTPEWESRDRGNLAELGDVEWEDVRDPDEPDRKSDASGTSKRNSGSDISDSGNKQCSD